MRIIVIRDIVAPTGLAIANARIGFSAITSAVVTAETDVIVDRMKPRLAA
ncbi:hypothetical protein [Phreatobacter stygius]|nr:hypothetical protein [Phreatobacter stygius]